MKNIKKIFGLFIITLIGIFIVACDDTPNLPIEEEPVYTITLNKMALSLFEGEDELITATVKKDNEIIETSVTWESSDESVATVEGGLITALATGNATIKATAFEKEATLELTVLEEELPDEVFLIITPKSVSLNVGESVTLEATFTDGSSSDIVWSSSNNEIATVSNGVVNTHQSGSVTITAVSGELNDSATINVTDTLELIFPELDEHYLIGEEIDLEVLVKINGDANNTNLEITGDGFTLDDGKVTFTKDGNISITASHDGVSSITRSTYVYYEVSTKEEFLAIGDNIDSLSKSYLLTSDLDFEGATINSFSSYGSNNSGINFKGQFNGNFHTISNFEPLGYKGDNDRSIFGYTVEGSVIENINFIGVIGKERSATVASYLLGGIVRNVFVEMTYYGGASNIVNDKNPASVVFGKKQAGAEVYNIVSVVNFAPDVDVTYFGGISSLMYGSMANVHYITDKQLTTGGLVPFAMRDFNNLIGSFGNDSGAYESVNAFYEANPNLPLFNITEDKYPHLGEIIDTVELTNIDTDVFVGTKTQLNVLHNHKVKYSLLEPVTGVSVSDDGIITVSSEALGGSKFEILVESYFTDASDSLEFTVNEDVFSIDMPKDLFEIEYIIDVDEAIEEFDHNVSVFLNNNLYDGNIEFISSNLNVAEVDNDKVLVKGEGSTTITIKVDGNTLGSFKVQVTLWNPVRTNEEFLEIGTDQESMAKRYVLLNDLDFEGEKIYSFSDYSTRNTLTFQGYFNGNSHTISNFEPMGYGQNNDRSIFGYMVAGSIVENTNFLGVIGRNRTATVASYLLGGVVRNVFVEMTYYGNDNNTANQANPAGAVLGKKQANAEVYNIVSVVNFAPGVDVTYFGGISSLMYGSMRNVHHITNKKLTTGGNIEYAMKDSGGLRGSVDSASGSYESIADFYNSNPDLPLFNITEEKYPHLGTINEHIEITNPSTNLYAGTNTQLQLIHNYKVKFSLVDSVEGISVSDTGLITVSESVVGGTIFEILVESYYTNDSDSLEFTVNADLFTIDIPESKYSVDYILEVDEPIEDFDHNVLVYLNGNLYDGEADFESSNLNVVEVDGDKVLVKGDGYATITVKANGNILGTFEVEVNIWNPVRTNEEFLAIGTDQESMSKKYILINDLDFKGHIINAFSSWHTNNSLGLKFTGHFDGDGKVISNFEPKGTTKVANSIDRAIFGYMDNGAIVENINFLGVIGKGRSAVVANWLENGTIRNILVEMTYYGSENEDTTGNNPAGVIVGKNQVNGIVENVISILTVIPGALPSQLGGITSITNGKLINAHLITNNENVPLRALGTGSVVDSVVYEDLDDFYNNLPSLEGFNLISGKIPHVVGLEDDVEILNENFEMFQGTNTQIYLTNKFGVTFSIYPETAGVSINENGLLSVSSSVPLDTVFEVVAESIYIDKSDQIEFTIVESNFSVSIEQDEFNFEFIYGVDEDQNNTLDHNVKVLLNDEDYEGEVLFESNNPSVATASDTTITAHKSGTATISIIVNGNTLDTFIVNVVGWNPVTNNEEFLAIGTNSVTMSERYILLNDLDFEGDVINAFSSWATRLNIKFTGHFDGNNHTISNFEPKGPSISGGGVDRAIFGYMDDGAIVENTNFIGVIGKGRVAVVANWIEKGTVRNIYVEMTYYGMAGEVLNAANPGGVIVGKNQANGLVENVVAILDVVSGSEPDFMGGITSINSGQIVNAHLITTGKTSSNLEITFNHGGNGTITNSFKYANVDEFYNNPPTLEGFSLVEGKYPHLGTVSESFVINNTSNEVLVGINTQVTTTSKYGVTFALEEAVEGISITKDGLLFVDINVPSGTDFIIVATSKYSDDFTSLEFSVKEGVFEALSPYDDYHLDLIKGEDEYELLHEITLLFDGQLYEGSYELSSTDENVFTVDNTNITAISDGSATLQVLLGGVVVDSFNVKVDLWNPVRTNGEFLAIGTNKTTMSEKYKLLNDLDFEGEKIASFSSWGTNSTDELNFSGYFNGNNHIIRNFEPVAYGGVDAGDRSIFGYTVDGSVIENIQFLDVIGKGRASVVASYTLEGTFRNIYIEMNYVQAGYQDGNNPASTAFGKVQTLTRVSDIVVILTVAEGITPAAMGGIASLNYGENSLKNVHVITSYSGTLDISYNKGPITDSAKHVSIQDFLNSQYILNFDENIWDFDTTLNKISLK